MSIWTKFFKKQEKSPKELSGEIFQNYLKIKTELQVSDIKLNGGINFKVNYRGSVVPFWLVADAEITQEVAEAKIRDVLPTVAVGLALNLNLVEISQTLKK